MTTMIPIQSGNTTTLIPQATYIPASWSFVVKDCNDDPCRNRGVSVSSDAFVITQRGVLVNPRQAL